MSGFSAKFPREPGGVWKDLKLGWLACGKKFFFWICMCDNNNGICGGRKLIWIGSRYRPGFFAHMVVGTWAVEKGLDVKIGGIGNNCGGKVCNPFHPCFSHFSLVSCSFPQYNLSPSKHIPSFILNTA